jgi:glycosyltransferase involved in cell wall biosynthesis
MTAHAPRGSRSARADRSLIDEQGAQGRPIYPRLAEAQATVTSGRQVGSIAPRPSVSVIVTVLDERHTVDRLVESVTVQLREHDELVVVDGGSSDGTYARLLEHARRDPRVRVLEAPASNIAAGRNLAVHAARHDLIACTDAGCHVAPQWLERLVEPLLPADSVDGAPGLAAGVPHVLAHGPLQRAQSLACYADPGEAANTTPLVRLYGRLFGGVFDPTLPFARSLAFTRRAWRDAGGFPERLRWVEDGVFGRAVAARHRCVLAAGADVYWEQRESVGATFKMYYRYGIGAAESGDRQLQGRDGLRLTAYLLAPAMLVSRDRRAVAIALAGGAAYYSLPLLRAARYRAGVRAALCIPPALAIKDLGKIAGAVSARVAGRGGSASLVAARAARAARAAGRGGGVSPVAARVTGRAGRASASGSVAAGEEAGNA